MLIKRVNFVKLSLPVVTTRQQEHTGGACLQVQPFCQ